MPRIVIDKNKPENKMQLKFN